MNEEIKELQDKLESLVKTIMELQVKIREQEKKIVELLNRQEAPLGKGDPSSVWDKNPYSVGAAKGILRDFLDQSKKSD